MKPLDTATIAEVKSLLKKLFASQEQEVQAWFTEQSVFSLNELNDAEVIRLMKAMEFIESTTAQPAYFYNVKEQLESIIAQ